MTRPPLDRPQRLNLASRKRAPAIVAFSQRLDQVPQRTQVAAVVPLGQRRLNRAQALVNPSDERSETGIRRCHRQLLDGGHPVGWGERGLIKFILWGAHGDLPGLIPGPKGSAQRDEVG